MFRDKRPIGPVRGSLRDKISEYSQSDDQQEDVGHPQEHEDDNQLSNDKVGNDLHDMISKWKRNINSDEAQKKMLKNYIDAYVDLTEEEMEEVLAQHGF